MTEPVDPVLLGVRMVALSPAVSEICAGRIFGAELPASEGASMPRACIVVASAGLGASPPGVNDYMHQKASRLDIRCYGSTPVEAQRMGLFVDRHMQAWDRTTMSGMVSWWAKRVSGPVTYRTDPGDWPVSVWTYDVLHADSLTE